MFQSKEKKQAVAAARELLTGAAATLSTADPADALTLANRIAADQSLDSLADKERAALTDRAFGAYVENVLADDVLTTDEEEHFGQVGAALGFTTESIQSRHPDLLSRLVVAKVNDGRLSEIDEPQIIRKKGEVVYLEVVASLLKEVAMREFRGASQGVSFQVAKGVRYRVGGMRGHMVTVGTEMKVQDTGTLAVSSQRIAYLGSAKSSEILYTKLMGMNVFSDGLRLQASNRQTPLIFRLAGGISGDAVAATINAAMQRTLE